MRSWPWAGAALAVSVLAPLVAAPAPSSAAPAPPAAPTPVLSVRRDPAWIESTLAAQRLDTALTSITRGQTGGSTGLAGCLVVSQGATTLFGLNPDQELIPASNMKLLTATAVLDRLGPQDRLATKVVAQRAPVGGVVYGNLYLVGGGDPLLMTDAYASATYVAGYSPNPPVYTSVDRLAAAVEQAGIRAVTGRVIGDNSRYDAQQSVPTWSPVYIAERDVAPLSALEVNDDTPPPPPKPTTPPPAPKPTVPPPTTTTTVPAPPPAPPDPTLNAATIFATALRQAGVAVAGAATGAAPGGAPVVAQIQSAPLAAEVGAMLRVSDDTAAELLTKELGYQSSGAGTTAAGVAAERADLQADGLPVSQMTALDGSGLDRGDQASCNLLAATLRRAGPSGTLAQGLPVAARTGTLLGRMAGTPAAGRVVAKTGNLNDVASLSGFVSASPSAPTPALAEPLVFSMLLDGRPDSVTQPLLDRVAESLAAYPEVPPLAAVSPSP